MNLDENFWTLKYQTEKTGWDIGYISTPLKTYIDQLTDKNLKILIPGGGNSYEAEYLFKQGFSQVYVADISKVPLNNLTQRILEFPKSHLLHADFFELKQNFDLIIEQTFFCALAPQLRKAYVKKMHELLEPNGKLVGLLFNFPMTEDGPPFGGDESEYRLLFLKNFEISILEEAYNSIPQRDGNELFFKLLKK
jgi:SAM-dependent methyltransferase